MTTLYTTSQTLRDLRTSIYLCSLPKPVVVWRVFDTLTLAIASLEPIAEYKRKSVIARYHCPLSPKLRFVLLFKR